MYVPRQTPETTPDNPLSPFSNIPLHPVPKIRCQPPKPPTHYPQRAIESPADDDFLHALRQDYTSIVNSDIALPKPPSRASSLQTSEFVSNSLLGVLVCLKPEAAVPTSTSPPATTGDAPPAAQLPPQPTPIGRIHLENLNPRGPHHRNSTIGINMAAEFQGKGYGTEAIEWILRWGFQTAGLHRIAISCFSWNTGAERLYRRIGFVDEGRSRDWLWHEGAWGDLVNFSMLEGEWRARAKGEGRGGRKAAGDMVSGMLDAGSMSR